MSLTSHSKTARTGARFGVVAALALLWAGSCSQDKETLVVVGVTAAPPAPGLTSLVLTIGSTQKTFPLANGLTDVATSFGVYVPSGVVGSVDLSGAATGPGGLCYHGTKTTTIVSSGMQVNETLALTPASTCGGAGGSGGGAGGSGGGAGGAGGTTGSGGESGGTSGGGPGGAPPTGGASGGSGGASGGASGGSSGGSGGGSGGS
ncbi:MAG TPA: hypothetical protein VHJ20_23170, partial [Polyangia bacterium]|nr:hypothetical protein [Polyangia bacterium]